MISLFSGPAGLLFWVGLGLAFALPFECESDFLMFRLQAR
jgi:hypothetical protein